MFNQVVDYTVFLAITSFFCYNFYIMFNMVYSDMVKPYIGISSSYIFNFFIFDTISLFCLVKGFFSWKELLSLKTFQMYFLFQIIALYQAVIFLIKKYNYTYVKNEAKLTCLLMILLFMIVASFVAFPKLSLVNEFARPYSYAYWVFLLNCTFGRGAFYLPTIIFIIKIIPLFILGGMWTHSVSKKYNKYEMSYFTKSSNKTIFTFLLYESILALSPFFFPQNSLEIVVFLLVLFSTKVVFVKSVLDWLQHPDMESMETNAILRSGKNYD